MALSVEETKPRLIYDARPLNKFLKHIPFSMDTVARVANVASEGCFMTSLDDSSAFHHIHPHPPSLVAPTGLHVSRGGLRLVCPPFRA